MITGKIISKPSWSTYVQLKPLGIPVSLLAGFLSHRIHCCYTSPEILFSDTQTVGDSVYHFSTCLNPAILGKFAISRDSSHFPAEIEIMTCTQSFLCYFPCHHAHHGSSKTENLKTRPRQIFYVSELDWRSKLIYYFFRFRHNPKRQRKTFPRPRWSSCVWAPLLP